MVEPTILKIGISTWVNMLAAFATLALVFVTSWTVRHMKKQMVFMHKQTLLAVKEQSPILQIEEFEIKGNSLILKIKNVGRGNAHQIGVCANFENAKPEITGYDKENGTHLGRIGYDPEASLIDDFENEKHEIINSIGNGTLNYISKSQKRVVILRPEQSVNIEMEPEFWLELNRSNGDFGGRFINFVDLIELLKKNGRQFVGFSFELVCKNGVEDVQDIVPITNFSFDLINHKTLEDAKKQGRPLYFLPLLMNDLETRVGVICYKFYEMKSNKNIIPGEYDRDTEDTFKKMK